MASVTVIYEMMENLVFKDKESNTTTTTTTAMSDKTKIPSTTTTQTVASTRIVNEPYLDLTVGPMNSGKTTMLCGKLKKYQKLKKRCLVISPTVDTRTRNPLIDVISPPSAFQKFSSQDLAAYINDVDADHDFDIAIVDECQFLISLATNVQLLAHKKVFVAGLDLDYRQIPFPATQELREIATKIHLFQSTCKRCGSLAPYTARINDGKKADPAVFFVGEVGLQYLPMCGNCIEKCREKDVIY